MGGRSFSTQQFDVAVDGRRQPGSAFKPFALATAIKQGISPTSVFLSEPKSIDLGGGSTWKVSTYSGGYAGKISLTDATVESDNTVYADLAMMVGPANIAATATEMGVTSPIGDNPSIALGGLTTGVSPLEMANAYATLATGGQRLSGTLTDEGQPAPISIRRVTDDQGHTLAHNSLVRSRVLEPWQAGLETSILQQVIARGTGVAAAIGRPAAGKSGTTTDYADAWFCGYTPDLSAAVWVGYPASRTEMIVRGIRVAGGTFLRRSGAASRARRSPACRPTTFPRSRRRPPPSASCARVPATSPRDGAPNASPASTSRATRPPCRARSTGRAWWPCPT